MTEKQKIELLAVADFLDWLCEGGFVVASSVEDASFRGTAWTPITPEDGDKLASRFVRERSQ